MKPEAEIRTARTARKTHYCGMRSAGCTRLIRPGDRHVVTALPPVGDILTFPGRTGWRQIRSCAGCVRTLYGQTPDERAARPVVTTPTSPHRDEVAELRARLNAALSADPVNGDTAHLEAS